MERDLGRNRTRAGCRGEGDVIVVACRIVAPELTVIELAGKAPHGGPAHRDFEGRIFHRRREVCIERGDRGRPDRYDTDPLALIVGVVHLPENMTDDHRVGVGGNQSGFIKKPELGFDSRI